MADTLDTLTTKVADLQTRVAKLEKGTPSPTPTPTPTPTPVGDSPDLTTVPPALAIRAGGSIYSIVAGKVQINAIPVADTGSVTTLKLVKAPANPVPGGVYQKNSAGNWYGPVTPQTGGTQVAGDPSVKFPAPTPSPTPSPTPAPTPAPTPGGAPQPPAAAKAHNFNTLAFFSGFDSPSEVSTDRSGNTVAKWYATASGLRYTVSNSVLALKSSVSSFNDDVSTVANAGAQLTTPGAIRQGNGSGTRFKYGCYEALLKYSPGNVTGNGWIAWWASGFEGNVAGDSSKNSIEWDFFESFQPGGPGQSSTGLWNWAASGSSIGTFATSGWGDVMYKVSQATANAAAGNYADWFIVGGVATDSLVEVYFNTKAGRASGKADTTIFSVDTTKQYQVNAGGKQVSAVFDASRLCTMELMLGGADGSEFDIDYVAVWQ
jgi:hypothetical protein